MTVFAPVGAYEFTAWYPRLETQPKYQSAQVRVPVIYQIPVMRSYCARQAFLTAVWSGIGAQRGMKRRCGGKSPGDTGLGVGNHRIRLCGALPPLSLS